MVDKLLKRVDFILAVFLCLFAFSGKTAAQTSAEDYIVVNRLTRENGLPDQDVNGIFFDSKGFAWISTFGGGLVRYDGDSFIPLSTKTVPEFQSDFVDRCSEDDYGRLWVPCAGILNIVDLETLTLIDELPGMSSSWRHSHSPVNLHKDARGHLWFTAEDMLYRINFAEDGERIVIDSLQCKVSNVNLMPNPCDVDGDGSVWVAVNGQLSKVRFIEGRGLCMSEILPDLNIGEDNKTTALLRAGNEAWIGTSKGLYRVNLSTGNHICYLHSGSDPGSIPNDEITGLYATAEGEIVIGTLGGVCIYNATDQTFTTYGSQPNAYGNRLLPGDMVRGLATRGRQIWVGLEAKGLAVIQKKPLQIINFSRIETPSSIIPSNTPIRALFIDSRNVLWLAATGYGILRQTDNRIFRNYNTVSAITTFCEDGRGRIWTGSVTGRLNYIDPSAPDILRSPEGNMSDTARSIDVILGICYDKINDYIWITAHNGLYFYDLRNATFSRFHARMSSCFSAHITEDKLLVSGMEGLSIIDLRTRDTRLIKGFPSCLSLVTDGDTLWAGAYGRGVYRVDDYLSDASEITVYSEKEGLADNQVQGLLLDGVNLWITTENGLSCIDTQVGEVARYGIQDGLKSMAFCENSLAKGKSGNIYLGQKEGLSILRSGYVRKEYGNKPDIAITGYYARGEFHPLALSDVVYKNENDNDFFLKFSDLSYSRRSDITYESRVLPMDKEWSPIFGNSSYFRFGHIPGGKNKVQVRAVDKEGNVLSQDEITLQIKPALFKRWWFRLLAVLLLGLLTYLFILWDTKSISKKKDQLQQEVDRQTKELKEQKEELERKAEELSEQNALLQRQNEMIASHNTLLAGTLSNRETEFYTLLLDAIQKKYKDPDLDVHGLAEAMGMSRSLLNEKIQNTLGLSIAQFIRTYRLNVAKEMICNGTNTDMNISEIAYEVGFNDPKYFTRCFTKEFDATPSDLYRKSRETD